MQSTEQTKPLFGADNNALVALVSANLMIAVTYGMTRMVYFLEGFPMSQFYDEVVHHFMLSPYYQEALEKPWTFFIYNWSHDHFWTLCGNMIWLTVFGNILQCICVLNILVMLSGLLYHNNNNNRPYS